MFIRMKGQSVILSLWVCSFWIKVIILVLFGVLLQVGWFLIWLIRCVWLCFCLVMDQVIGWVCLLWVLILGWILYSLQCRLVLNQLSMICIDWQCGKLCCNWFRLVRILVWLVQECWFLVCLWFGLRMWFMCLVDRENLLLFGIRLMFWMVCFRVLFEFGCKILNVKLGICLLNGLRLRFLNIIQVVL